MYYFINTGCIKYLVLKFNDVHIVWKHFFILFVFYFEPSEFIRYHKSFLQVLRFHSLISGLSLKFKSTVNILCYQITKSSWETAFICSFDLCKSFVFCIGCSDFAADVKWNQLLSSTFRTCFESFLLNVINGNVLEQYKSFWW